MTTLIRAHLKEELGAQLITQFEVSILNDQYVVITPMLYPDNTQVSLYVEELEDGKLMLTDNGEAAAYAFVNGLSDSVIRERVRITKHRFRIAAEGSNELRLECSRDQLAETLFTLATAIQDVAYLVYKNRDY